MSVGTSSGATRRRGTPNRLEWALVLAVVVIAGLLVHPYRAQQASRYTLTAAVVERGSVVLDDYEDVLGIDRAVRDGHVYSDKAPGQPMYAVPFFLAGKALGVEGATTPRVDRNLGLWWVTLVSSVVPAAALVVMMYRRARQEDDSRALLATGSIFLGTLLLPFSSLLFGHVMAAALLYGSYLLLVHPSASSLRLILAGLLSGLAVTVEYTAMLGVLVLGVFALVRYQAGVLKFVVGGIPAALALASYNWVAFGHPLVLSYQFSAFSEVTESARPLVSPFSSASLDNTLSLLIDGRGLLVATPVVIVAVAGAIWRLSKGKHPDAAVAFAMFAVFILLPIFWGNPWGGESPGPRYMTPAIPFLAVPLMWALARWRVLTMGVTGISILTMVAATLTDPLALPRDSIQGLGYWLSELLGGQTVDTLATIALGSAGWILHGVALVAVAYLVAKARESPGIQMRK